MMNYYEELELNRGGNIEELQAELVKTQKKWLNRTNSSDLEKRTIAEKKLQVIEEAKRTFLDAETRLDYDKTLMISEIQPQQATATHQVDTEDWKNNINNLMKREQFAQAITQAKQWTEMAPHDPIAWRFFALAHKAFGNKERAVEYYLNSLELEPENFQTYADLGLLYVDMGNYSNAERYFMQSLQLKPDYEVALHGAGYVNQHFGNHDVALQYMEQLAENNPSKGHDADLAEAYYLKAISIMPANDRNEYFFYEEEKIKEYIRLTEKAQSLYPTEEYTQQLKKAKKALGKSYDWTKVTLLTLPLFVAEASPFLALLLFCVILYFSIRPRWIMDRRKAFGVNMTFDRIASIYTKTVGALIIGIIALGVGMAGISMKSDRYR